MDSLDSIRKRGDIVGLFDSYRRKVGTSQPQNYATNCDITSQIAQDFYLQPGYAEVYKNGISTVTYDVIISEGDKINKTVGYKTLQSYPYAEIQFQIGDYIYWTYGNENTIWLLTSLDKQHLFSITGRMYQCNNELNWTVGATPHSYPCYIEDKMNFTVVDQERNISFPTGDVWVHVQKNADTSNIDIGQRFVLNGRAWKVRQVRDFVEDGLISFPLQFDYDDDADTNIGAVNGVSFPWS